MKPVIGLFLFVVLLFSACTRDLRRFTKIPGSRSGITFSNNVAITDSFNAVIYQYVYNGGGVAAGDINNDGFTDIFFGGNQVSSKLYLNKGNLQFVDVTGLCGVSTKTWITGVSIIDINNDGLNDIYLCVADDLSENKCGNLLFINLGVGKKGIPAFKEMAKQYGLNEHGYCNQAAFLDYDKDGDVDVYILKNILNDGNKNAIRSIRVNSESASTDRLFRNNGDGTFSDVSAQAGITIEGYGLGVVVNDINMDGWPDIYVSNDFISNDLLWINNKNGTFTNKAREYLKHTSYNGMGVDAADYNNDQLPDILQVDMLPEDSYGEKMMINNQNVSRFKMSNWKNYQDQYIRNTLQLNRGNSINGEPVFSDISFYAGVAATGWSWAPLFCDMDNDGMKDIFISTGYRKDITNLDFVTYTNPADIFGGDKKNLKKEVNDRIMKLKDRKPQNYFFRNNGNLAFENITGRCGIDDPSFSNGAIYADLDNDGDLDIVINNIDQQASLYENISDKKKDKNHFIDIKLQLGNNKSPLNTKVYITCKDSTQYIDYTPVRGYLSSADDRIHFGTGKNEFIDTLMLVWPDGNIIKRYHVPCDTLLAFAYEGRENIVDKTFVASNYTLFSRFNQQAGIGFQYHPNELTDFQPTSTIPHVFTRQGPSLAVADINGDRLDDFFVGGNQLTTPSFYIQAADGKFTNTPFDAGPVIEQTGSLLFDANNDGNNDLLICTSGYLRSSGAEVYAKKLFINDGNGRFTLDSLALPAMNSPASCVVAADFDMDNDIDLFIGGQVQPQNYPLPARSYLLLNDKGKFTDVTTTYLPGIVNDPGIVNAALWTDYNGDEKIDLIIVGEWMPIRVFKNEGNRFEEVTASLGLGKTNGGWNSINGADLDNDGDIDYVLGNIGENSKYSASFENPMEMYADDYDKNGSMDPFIFINKKRNKYSIHPRDMLADQVPAIKRRFDNYEKFAKATFAQILHDDEIKGAGYHAIYELKNIILENVGGKGFQIRPLPGLCQLTSLFGTMLDDINNDGVPDIVAIGNSHATETMLNGWLDASYGEVLLGQENFQYKPASVPVSGLEVGGDGKTIGLINSAGNEYLLCGQNDGLLLCYKKNIPGNRKLVAKPFDAYVSLYSKGKLLAKAELYYGNGYLSQSSRVIHIPPACDRIVVTTFDGTRSEIKL